MKLFKLIKAFYEYPIIAVISKIKVIDNTVNYRNIPKQREKINSIPLGSGLLRKRKILNYNKELITKGE